MEHLNFKTIVLSALAVLGLAVSCSKENKPEKKTETKPELSVSETQLVFSSFGEEKTFTVTANMEGFKAEVTKGDETWCHVSLDGNTVKVLVDKNEAYEMRSTTVTVTLQTEKKRVRIEQEATPDPANMPKAITPMTVEQFTDSRVYNVMAAGVKVAEMCREYLCVPGSIDNQAIVIYPVVDGKAVHTKGIVLFVLNQKMEEGRYTDTFTLAEGNVHGGTVSFEGDAITEYVAGDKAAADIKLVCRDEKGELKIVAAKTPEMVETTAEARTAKDASGNVYGIVKIASHYWLTDDLNTTKTTDGTEIPAGKVAADYNSAVATYVNSKFKNKLYSAAAAGWNAGAFADKISPEGFTIPAEAVWNALVEYLGQTGKAMDDGNKSQKAVAKMRTIGEAGNWLDVWEEPWKTTGSSNLSGLSLNSLGYRFLQKEETEDAYEGTLTDTFYATSDANQFGLIGWHVSGGSVNGRWDAWGGDGVANMSWALRCVSL